MFVAPLNPASPHNRTLYPITGTITKLVKKETGFWIFKTKLFQAEIELDTTQVSEFNAKELPKDTAGLSATVRLSPTIKLRLDEEQFGKYCEGETIIITFGYAGQIQQFFQGQAPLIVMDMK